MGCSENAGRSGPSVASNRQIFDLSRTFVSLTSIRTVLPDDGGRTNSSPSDSTYSTQHHERGAHSVLTRAEVQYVDVFTMRQRRRPPRHRSAFSPVFLQSNSTTLNAKLPAVVGRSNPDASHLSMTKLSLKHHMPGSLVATAPGASPPGGQGELTLPGPLRLVSLTGNNLSQGGLCHGQGCSRERKGVRLCFLFSCGRTPRDGALLVQCDLPSHGNRGVEASDEMRALGSDSRQEFSHA